MRSSQILKLKLPVDEGGVEMGLVAGSEEGLAGHKDGWGKSSLFNHPKDLAVDDEGNVYVADLRDFVIRKINYDDVVSTIAGESNVSGFADGEGRKAHFSADFDVTYISSICSLLVSDRGNRRLRLIQLRRPDVCKGDRKSREFSVGLEGLLFVISGTVLLSTFSVLVLRNVNLRQRLAGMHLIDNRLMWTRSGDGLYSPLPSGEFPQLPPNAVPSPQHTQSLPAHLPDLIDLSNGTSAAAGARRAAAITEDAHYRRGSDDPAEGSENPGTAARTQNAPAALISVDDGAGDSQRLSLEEQLR